jgi:ectoine hydroxylase-related dioxygenase (phytanoyl-CoA dioxygenase family)
MAPLVPAGFAAVQCTYFEKSASRNWLVPVHQDLSIPVADHAEHASLSGWSRKEGTLYVQPPAELLEQLVAVRLHIDACGATDGPLRVVPGSHLYGRMQAKDAAAARQVQSEFTCTAGQGSAMAIRPLLLHASSRSTGGNMRRVLHFLFGPRVLPFGLRWQRAI